MMRSWLLPAQCAAARSKSGWRLVDGRICFATEDCCALIDDELLKQINCTASVVIATVCEFQLHKSRRTACTIKSAPFAVAQAQLEAVMSILNERGPILQARPIRDAGVAVLYTDPVHGDRARTLFESILRTRLERFNANVRYAFSATEDEEQVTRAMGHLLRAKTVGDSGGIDNRSRRSGRCNWPGHGARRAHISSDFSLRSSPAICC